MMDFVESSTNNAPTLFIEAILNSKDYVQKKYCRMAERNKFKPK